MAYTPKNFPYHEWLSKTNFSFLTGASHPSQMIETAATLGYNSLAINDFSGAYGLARSYNELCHYKKKTPTSLKLNYGCEIYLQRDDHLPLLHQKTLALIAKNKRGYQQMNELVTQGLKAGGKNYYVSEDQLFKQDLSDLIAIVPMRLYPWENTDHRLLKKLYDHFSGFFYFAITKTYNRWSDHRIGKIHQLAKILKIRELICQDAFFHHRDQKSFHDILMALKKNQTLKDSLAEFFPNGERSFHSRSFLWKTYRSFPNFQAIMKHSNALAEQCQFCLSDLRYHYPREMIPDHHTPQSYLEALTWEAAKKYFGDPLPPKIHHLLNKELDLIEDLSFADYFLTVWDIVRWAREQNILCQGRGSAANSAVCFTLGITSCDPAHFDLLFERFINKERGDPPDIDVDFEHERREEVLQYIYRRYGRNKAAMVANVITFRKKGALRAIGKTLNLPESLIAKASHRLSQVSARGQSLKTVVEALKREQNKKSKNTSYQQNSNETRSETSNKTNNKINNKISNRARNEIEKKIRNPPNDNTSRPLLERSLKDTEDFQWQLWFTMAEKLKGFPHHLGLHSGGFIVSQYPITQLVPIEPATMEGRTVIQWCKDDIEELGFFKIDCLSLGMLTALRKCFSLIQQNYGHSLSLKTLPQEDRITYEMIQRADTVGVFQIESRAQMSMLPRLKPRCFYDLVIEIAIIRPGPIQGQVIHPYLRRRDGLDPITYPDSKTRAILQKTLGVVIFQEQAMRLAMLLGDFTPGEANELRKTIGSWNSKAFDRNINPYLKKLLAGLQKNKIDKKFANQLIQQMRGFSHYGFPESHAISFAFLAYASCYLKCHYPAAFTVAVLNSQPMGFYSPHALLSQAKRQGVTIRPLSINHSNWDHQLELLPQAKSKPKEYAIRLGFRLVKGLSENLVRKIEKHRRVHGQWSHLNDFCKDIPLHRNDFSALAATNAFQDFGLSRFEALWQAHAYPFKPLIDTEEKNFPELKRRSFQKIQMDFSAFGTSLQKHPCEIIKNEDWPYSLKTTSLSLSKDLQTQRNGQRVVVFGMLLSKQAPPSAKGMVFFTLEDETGFINVVFAPNVYSKYRHLAENSGFLCLTGKLQKVNNYHSLLATQVLSPNLAKVRPLYNSEKNPPSEQKISLKPRNYY